MKGDDMFWFCKGEIHCPSLLSPRNFSLLLLILACECMLWAAAFPLVTSSMDLIKILHVRGLFQPGWLSCRHILTMQGIHSKTQWKIIVSVLHQRLKGRQATVWLQPNPDLPSKIRSESMKIINVFEWPSANNTFICSCLCLRGCLPVWYGPGHGLITCSIYCTHNKVNLLFFCPLQWDYTMRCPHELNGNESTLLASHHHLSAFILEHTGPFQACFYSQTRH